MISAAGTMIDERMQALPGHPTSSFVRAKDGISAWFEGAWTKGGKGELVNSATSEIDVLFDGRVHCWIRHDVVREVTPAMLDWWFQNLAADTNWAGLRLSHYKV